VYFYSISSLKKSSLYLFFGGKGREKTKNKQLSLERLPEEEEKNIHQKECSSKYQHL